MCSRSSRTQSCWWWRCSHCVWQRWRRTSRRMSSARRTTSPTSRPRRISFRLGGLITGIVGMLMMPWKLVADPAGYIFTWLIGYSALLRPIGGIMIADYFAVRRRRLIVAALYDARGEYRYTNGFSVVALIALVVGVAESSRVSREREAARCRCRPRRFSSRCTVMRSLSVSGLRSLFTSSFVLSRSTRSLPRLSS